MTNIRKNNPPSLKEVVLGRPLLRLKRHRANVLPPQGLHAGLHTQQLPRINSLATAYIVGTVGF